MTTLHYFLSVLETGLSMNVGCLYEDDDNNGDVGDSEDARDMISATFQEHLCDRWNLKYLDQLSTYYLRLGLARSVTHTVHTYITAYIQASCRNTATYKIHTYSSTSYKYILVCGVYRLHEYFLRYPTTYILITPSYHSSEFLSSLHSLLEEEQNEEWDDMVS
jgi:hypothetical protein